MSGNLADPLINVIKFHFGAGWEKPLLLLISLGFFASMVANNTFGSRLLYAFARDRMVPAAGVFTRLSRSHRLPYNAILVTAGMTILVLLLNLGLEKVYASLISVAVLSWYVSYAFPVFSRSSCTIGSATVPAGSTSAGPATS